MKNERIAVYPGTFDPITYGHLDIIERAVRLFDKVIVAIALNKNKTALFRVEERIEMIEESTKNIQGVEIVTFQGLSARFSEQMNAIALIRGLRAVSDFEYEFQMALINRKIGKNTETVFLMPTEKNTYLSSSVVREIASFHGDVSPFVPDFVQKKLEEKFKDESTRDN
ncbi:MAG: pantetheine-phosphate adenylyltransferase [Candidatus Marinimicrobia bacterium]|nr:pantetheine-phosphate adenylyltransferase [Candidatus Neomarinimicrobiota bacterium]